MKNIQAFHLPTSIISDTSRSHGATFAGCHGRAVDSLIYHLLRRAAVVAGCWWWNTKRPIISTHFRKGAPWKIIEHRHFGRETPVSNGTNILNLMISHQPKCGTLKCWAILNGCLTLPYYIHHHFAWKRPSQRWCHEGHPSSKSMRTAVGTSL